jgi:hypothetical protein
MKLKLWQLSIGERFTDPTSRRVYVVTSQEGGMTEVRYNGKYWAWPNQAVVLI